MKIRIKYFALFRDEVGKSDETVDTNAKTAGELLTELYRTHKFSLQADQVRVAINEEFRDLRSPIKEGDRVVLIPPVAGG